VNSVLWSFPIHSRLGGLAAVAVGIGLVGLLIVTVGKLALAPPRPVSSALVQLVNAQDAVDSVLYQSSAGISTEGPGLGGAWVGFVGAGVAIADRAALPRCRSPSCSSAVC